MKSTPVFSLNSGSWYRGFIQGKTRIALAWIFAAFLILTAREYPTWPGLLICFLGATLRFWASGFLRKDSRPAVGGPYAHTRNPLYLGTYLMAAGACVAIGNFWLLLGLTVLYVGIYHYIILDEETKLHRIFGEPYSLYIKQVPRFFPRLTHPAQKDLLRINPDLDHHHFSRELARKNKALEPYWSFIGLVAAITLFAYLWKTFG